jgi:hypothetical protein
MATAFPRRLAVFLEVMLPTTAMMFLLILRLIKKRLLTGIPTPWS